MRFESIIGQSRAKRILNNLLKRPFIQNLLFTGPSGVGKRTMALLFAQTLNCPNGGCGRCRNCLRIERFTFPDLFLLVPISSGESLSERTRDYALGRVAPSLRQNELINIDHVRDIIIEAQHPPVEGRRVVIIIHAHRMRYEAVSALLKVIEEQPNDTIFILTTPQLSAIPETIQSRCQIVRFNYLKPDELTTVLKQKGINHEIISKAKKVAEERITKSIENLLQLNRAIDYHPNRRLLIYKLLRSLC